MKVKIMLVSMLVLVFAGFSFAGGPCCAAKAVSGSEGDAAAVAACAKKADAEPALCGKCGQVAGSELCCKEGAALCPKCGKHAGSPGCMACCKAMKAEGKAADCSMMQKAASEATPAAEESAEMAE